MLKLAPSILSADFAELGSALKAVTGAGAHYIHFDVMDGRFVPNISFGVPVLRSIRRCTTLVFDVHLMIIEPWRYIETFAEAGADLICVHWEAMDGARYERGECLSDCITTLRRLNKKAAVAINPHTPLEPILPYVELLDMVLIMSVEPGFGGQSLLAFTLEKAERLAGFIQKNNLQTEIEMDGGIGRGNLRSVLDAGVNVIVAGSSVFSAEGGIEYAVKGFLQDFNAYLNASKDKPSVVTNSKRMYTLDISRSR